MSVQAKKVPIKKIVTDLRYYPRATVDQGRILEFVEAMEYGEYFPPIKLVKNPETGLFVLLDGKHRLEACIMRDEAEIMADIFYIPEEHWLMASARFNSKSSKPLTANETKKIIIQTWDSGIKDTEVIALEMACTSRYVEMVLKPVRDEERSKRKKDILNLQEKGMKQRDIASKLGLSASCICKTIKQYEDTNNESLPEQKPGLSRWIAESHAGDEKFPKRSDFVLETASINFNINELDNRLSNSDQNFSSESPKNSLEQESEEEINHKIFQTPNKNISEGPSKTIDSSQKFPKRSNFVLETSNEANDIIDLQNSSERPDQNYESECPTHPPEHNPEIPAGDNSHEVFTKGSHFLLETPDEGYNGNDSKDKAKLLPQKSSPYPSYMDQIDLYNELTPQGQHAIRAMELAKKYKVDILDIAKEIGETVIWIKKVLMSAIALSLMNGDKLNSISSVETSIGIDFYVAEAIQAMLPFQTMLCPVAPEMEQWIKDNLSSQDLDIILNLVEVEKKHLPYLLKGQKPPARKSIYFEELPAKYKDQLQAYISVLRELRDHAKNKMFKGNSAKELVVQLNKNVIIINEIVDDFREDKLL